jgi:hypothetical protein
MIPFVNFWGDPAIPLTWQPKSIQCTWFSTDTEENFFKKENNIFTPESFGYNFNQYGYRIGNRDWDLNTTKKRIMSLGCSHSVGVGIPWNQTWGTMFAEYIGGESFNLSVAGASSDTVFRTLNQSIDIIKPDIVAIYWPEPIRWEMYESFQWDATGLDCDIPHMKSVWNISDTEIINESHVQNLFNRNVKLVKLLQRIHGFKLIEIDSNALTMEYLNNYNHIKNAYSFDARDLVHPGVTMHEYIKNKFIDTYSNL